MLPSMRSLVFSIRAIPPFFHSGDPLLFVRVSCWSTSSFVRLCSLSRFSPPCHLPEVLSSECRRHGLSQGTCPNGELPEWGRLACPSHQRESDCVDGLVVRIKVRDHVGICNAHGRAGRVFVVEISREHPGVVANADRPKFGLTLNGLF
jgi:hypothetical protein